MMIKQILISYSSKVLPNLNLILPNGNLTDKQQDKNYKHKKNQLRVVQIIINSFKPKLCISYHLKVFFKKMKVNKI